MSITRPGLRAVASKPDNRTKFGIFGINKFPALTKSFFKVEQPEWVLEALASDAQTSLAEYPGVIIPSGVFEHLTFGQMAGAQPIRSDSDKVGIAKRESQILQLLAAKGWVCFLINRVFRGPSNSWDDNDLPKKLLTEFFREVEDEDPNPYITCRSGDFQKFFEGARFQTKFWAPFESATTLATTPDDVPIAAVLKNRIFFVPFDLAHEGHQEAQRSLQKLIEGILAYQKRHVAAVPNWLKSFQFQEEKVLTENAKKMELELTGVRQELEKWSSYKGLLAFSGENLSELVVQVLRDVFGLGAEHKDQDVEDAVIKGDGGQVDYVLEIKGISGGLRRTQIDQINSHRERLNISHDVPGLLVLNDSNEVFDIEQRRSTPLGQEHFAHATNNNTKILRTITLMEMIDVAANHPDRKAYFFSRLAQANPVVTAS